MKIKLLIFLFMILASRAYSQSCTLVAGITASNNSICSGNSVTLMATASAGTPGYQYAWSTGETTQSISVNKVGTYTVTVSDQTAGCQPITKSITLTSGTTPIAPTAADALACPNTSATLTATGPGGTYQWYDAPAGGNFLASGAVYNTPPITAKTVFYVETTISGCPSARTPVTVFPIGAPNVAPAVTCAGSPVTLTASGAGSYQWYDAPSGGNLVGSGASFTTPALFATRNYYVVGTTSGCTSVPATVSVTVLPTPAAPVASGVSICPGSVATLHATADPGTTFDWYDVPTGGTSLIASPDYTTPALTTTTTFYVQANLNGCTGPRTAVTVTVNQPPASPTVADVTSCYGTTATLTATAPGGTYTWYPTATSNTVLFTGDTYITPILNASTTFYVEAVSVDGCKSPRQAVNVTVGPNPTPPTAAGQTICSGNATTLTASGTGTFEWYNVPTGGVALANTAGFNTPVLTVTTTYYVQTINVGCASARTPVVVTVNPIPTAPTASGVTVCSGSPATLSAAGSGASYEWYDQPTGGSLLASTQTFITPALTVNTTYYVQNIANGCISPRTAVTVTVNTIPAAPTASGTTICAGTAATLSATATVPTIEWYSAPTGGAVLATGSPFNTGNLTATTTFYVQAVNGSCVSARTPVIVNVTSTTNQFAYSSGTYCQSGTNPAPLINVPGGTFSASSPNLVINSTDGTINLTASTLGSYTITYTNACAISTEQVAIVLTPDANFSYSATAVCQGGPNIAPIFAGPSSTAGVFSATPAGLSFTDKTTGGINIKASAPGNYIITNTISAAGGCPTTTASVSLTIDQPVVVSAGPNQTVATGSVVQLSGSITGGVTTGTWSSGGTGVLSSATDPNATYTPGPGETSATLTLLSANPGTSCGPQSGTVTITFNTKPPAPAASGTSTCTGNITTLLVSPPFSGTYDWFSAATGGASLFTGTSFTTPPLSITTTYYVQTTVGGVSSNRTPVTVIVNAIPIAPTVAPVTPVCAGTAATLKASGPAGVYEWYNLPTGGVKLFTGAIFTTTPLIANTSYYVQTNFNNCISPTRTKVDVTVNPTPSITSAATGGACSGNAQNYLITADLPGTTFTYSRAAVTGISNAAISNQTISSITETLINTTTNSINVTYVIIPALNGCAGTPFNYIVTVSPATTVTSSNTDIVCSGSSANYTVTFNTSGNTVSWTRAAVAGISNIAVTTPQNSSTIQEALINTTNAPVAVDYIFSYGTAACTASTFKLTMTVNPKVNISSSPQGTACSGVPQSYAITSQVPGAVYNWVRYATTPGLNSQNINVTSNTIDETLVNTTNNLAVAYYAITTVANGCQSTPFVYQVVVFPKPPTPIANSNSPVCTGKTINLFTPTIIAGGTYAWTGPNGFKSTLQNPTINNATAADAGTYTLYLLANGCSSVSATVNVDIHELPNANAGADQIVCSTATSVQLAGSMLGNGTKTGIWTTSGTGTFSSVSDLNAQYFPSAQDKTTGTVTLTLTSTGLDDCVPSVDNMVIKFQPVPATDAGADQVVCSQTTNVPLNGKMLLPGNGTWTTSGNGTFNPSATQLNGGASPTYTPGSADIAKGFVKLTLTINSSSLCDIPSDDMLLTLTPPPTVNAGGTRYVLKGNTIVLNPTVSDENVTYLWTPNIFINNNTLKNPTITGDVDRVYTLTVTDSKGCTSLQSNVSIVVSPPLVIPNAFTPNGDGVNDLWSISGLAAYPDATVDIFDRNGQKIFHSIGYGKPWDGTYNNKSLPFGTYYYVIDTKLFDQVYSGYVAIVK